MTSPFPASSSIPGEGHLIAELQPHGITALSKLAFQYPLKLISPSPSINQKSVLVFLLTYGGGLVGGDQINLKIDVKAKSKLSIVTQGHTKVFKSPSRDVITRQKLQITLESGASACLLPDPVQPFAGSFYEQSQIFTLANDASLCLLDWVSAGRTARGEHWDLGSWSGRNEVWLAAQPDQKPRLLLRDNLLLEGDPLDSKEKLLLTKMHRLQVFGTLVLRGPQMESLAAFFLAEFSTLPRIGGRDFRSQEKVDKESGKVLTAQEIWRKERLQQEIIDGVLWSAAKVRGCTVVKFGSHTVEGGRNWIGTMVKEEGSISRQFGEESLMCIRP